MRNVSGTNRGATSVLGCSSSKDERNGGMNDLKKIRSTEYARNLLRFSSSLEYLHARLNEGVKADAFKVL